MQETPGPVMSGQGPNKEKAEQRQAQTKYTKEKIEEHKSPTRSARKTWEKKKKQKHQHNKPYD